MNEKDIKTLNIYEKLSLITDEIGVIEKNLNVQVNQKSSYKAVSERDVLDAVKPLEKKYRVFSYPVKREIVDKDTLVKETEYTDARTDDTKITRTNTLFMRLETIYRFVNLDKPEEFIETTVYGDGLDTGDKAPGKAMTYADKYALMKTYKLSTGDDPDKDASPETGYKKSPEKENVKKQIMIQDTQKEQIKNQFTEQEIKDYLVEIKKSKLSELTLVEASNLLKRKLEEK